MKKRKQPFTFEEFKSIYSRVPRLSIEAVVFVNGKIVLLKRDNPPEPGSWHMPGGTVLKDETLEQTVRRVVQEELGVDCIIGEMLGVLELNFENHFENIISLVYSVKLSKQIQASDTMQFFSHLPENTIRFQKEFLRDVVGITE